MPDNLPKFPLYLGFTLLVALGFFLGAFFFFQRGGYDPPAQGDIPFESLTRTTFAGGPTDFADSPRARVQKGVVLVDAAHRNAFREAELVTLLSRVTDRGYQVEFVGSFNTESEADRLPLLERGLSQADSFVVVLPRAEYTQAERGLVQRFVNKGGKLLLIADPTRDHVINSLAETFGLDFQADYLFNLVEYDLNFQHISVRDFQPGALTSELDEVVFYSSGSIQTSGTGLATTDANTQSSLSQLSRRFHPMATGNHRNVLAIYDLTFVIPPRDTIGDNNQLISNIADFLTDSQRDFELADFPSFFKGDVDILLGQPSLFSLGTDVKNVLAESQIDAGIREIEDASRDTVFLGLYDDSSLVAPYLRASGVQIGSNLDVPSISNIPLEGTSVVLLNRSQDRHVLVLLGSSEEALSGTVEQLGTGDFRAGLVDDLVGVYKTE